MNSERDLEGFYAIYYHGNAGPGLAQIHLGNGIITGADAVGGIWDGKFALDETNGNLKCSVTIRLPAGATLATTGAPPIGAEAVGMNFELPFDFATHPFVTLELPIGKINARFVRLR